MFAAVAEDLNQGGHLSKNLKFSKKNPFVEGIQIQNVINQYFFKFFIKF